MRREPEFFEDRELDLIYIAKRLKEALSLEELLTAHSVDYLVEPDTYTGGIIFRTARTGAFFYVPPEAQVQVRSLMVQHGYRPFEPEP